jgi:hypothetical protein
MQLFLLYEISFSYSSHRRLPFPTSLPPSPRHFECKPIIVSLVICVRDNLITVTSCSSNILICMHRECRAADSSSGQIRTGHYGNTSTSKRPHKLPSSSLNWEVKYSFEGNWVTKSRNNFSHFNNVVYSKVILTLCFRRDTKSGHTLLLNLPNNSFLPARTPLIQLI